jgi:hypothetical protein
MNIQPTSLVILPTSQRPSALKKSANPRKFFRSATPKRDSGSAINIAMIRVTSLPTRPQRGLLSPAGDAYYLDPLADINYGIQENPTPGTQLPPTVTGPCKA